MELHVIIHVGSQFMSGVYIRGSLSAPLGIDKGLLQPLLHAVDAVSKYRD